MLKNNERYSDLEVSQRVKRKYARQFKELFAKASDRIEFNQEELQTLTTSVIIAKKLSQSKKIKSQLPALLGKVPQDQILKLAVFEDSNEATLACRQIREELEKIGSSKIEYLSSSIISTLYASIYASSAFDASDKYFCEGVNGNMRYLWKTLPLAFAASSAISNFYFARNNLAPSVRDLLQDFSKNRGCFFNSGILSLKTTFFLLSAMATVGEAVFSATAIENIFHNYLSDDQEAINIAKLAGVIISFAVMTPITAKSMSSVSKRIYGYFKNGITTPNFDCGFFKNSAIMTTIAALVIGRLWGNYYVTFERLQQLSQGMSEDYSQFTKIMTTNINPDPTSLVATATKGVLVAESAYNLGLFIISRFLSSNIPANLQLRENNNQSTKQNQPTSESTQDYKKLEGWEIFIISSGLLNGGSGGFMNVPQKSEWYAKLWYFVCATLMSLAVACKTNFEKYINRVAIIESLLTKPQDDQKKLINFLEFESGVKLTNSRTIEDGYNNTNSSTPAFDIEMDVLPAKSVEFSSNRSCPDSSPKVLPGYKKANSDKGQIQDVKC